MDTEGNKRISREVIERAFNQGDLTVIDQYLATDATDHQEAPGANFCHHLKEVVMGLRTAFPDLHFEIHHMIAEGDIVAFHSTMTGTHAGIFRMGPQPLPPTGRKVSVPHMHFVRMSGGKTTDLWHVWNTPLMMQQLGVIPSPQPR